MLKALTIVTIFAFLGIAWGSETSPKIWRDRPAFSASSFEALSAYQKYSQYEADLKRAWTECPLAQKFAESLLERLATGSGLLNFLRSNERPKVVVVCKGSSVDSHTKLDRTIYVGAEILLSAKTDGDAAFVIAHEFSHITLGHLELEIARNRGLEVGNSIVTARTQEWEADASALLLMKNAGLDPKVAPEVFHRVRLKTDSIYMGVDFESWNAPFRERERLMRKQIKSDHDLQGSFARLESEGLKAAKAELRTINK